MHRPRTQQREQHIGEQHHGQRQSQRAQGQSDRHGHRAGSAALRQVARVVRSELRESDVGARWGGDEFTILAPNTAPAAALALAERIRSRIAAQVAPWPLTASIGLVTADGDEKKMRTDSASLLRAADKAMYEAKKRGKNAVVAADPPASLRMTS